MPDSFLRRASTALISALASIFVSDAGAAIVGPMLDPPAAAESAADAAIAISPQSIGIPRTGGLEKSGPEKSGLETGGRAVLYVPAACGSETGQVFPDSLAAPAGLVPSGSLSWAGIQDEAAISGLRFAPWSQSGTRVLVRELAAAQEPNLELLTGIAAPEPPTLILAGVALVAGGLVAHKNGRHRGQGRLQ